MNTQTKSKFSLITAMVIFGTIGIFRRWIPLGSGYLAMLRGLIGAAFLFLLMLLRRQKPDRAAIRKNFLFLAVSGAAIGFNWILLFEAYAHTTVATATLCYYLAPSFVILSSPLVFREKLTARRLLCAIAALGGMVLVSGVCSGGLDGDLTGVVLGIGAALLYAFVVMLNKKIADIDAFDKTLIQLGTAGIVLIPYVLMQGEIAAAEWTPLVALLVLVVGMVHTGVCYALYFGAVGHLPAQTAAILSYIDPIVACILGFALLHEPMDVFGVIGAVLILGAAIVSELPERGAQA